MYNVFMRPLLLALSLFFFLFISSSPLYASGLTTSTSTNRGQVQVRNENGVMYLTTQTNDEVITTQVITNPDGSTTISTTSAVISNTPTAFFSLPRGYSPDFVTFLNGVLTIVMVVSALLVFLYLILGAFKWITSGGDKGKTESARNQITAAVIGLIIVAASYAVLNLSLRFLGFSDLNDVLRQSGTIYGPAPSPTPEPVYETDLQQVIESTPSGANN